MTTLDQHNTTLLNEFLSEEGATIADFVDDCDVLLGDGASTWEISKIIEPLWTMMNNEDVAEQVSDLIKHWRQFVTLMVYRAPYARNPALLESFEIYTQYAEKDVDVQELVNEQFRLGYFHE